MPLVSVVLPTHSRRHLLGDSIASVLAQDMPDLELFVLDDGSRDGSADLIAKFAASDRRVRHIRFERNVGLPALTTAHGYAQSTGQYVAWQFDDCTWTTDHLSALLSAFKPGVGVAYGQVELHFPDRVDVFGQPFDRHLLESGNILANVAALVSREVYDTIGWIDPSILLKRSNDYDFWRRTCARFTLAFHPGIVAVERGITLHDSLGNSVSVDMDLSRRYMDTDRSAYLHIRNVTNWEPFAPQHWMTAADREELAFLTMEHFYRVGRKQEGFDLALPLLGNVSGEPDEVFVRMLTKRRDAKLNANTHFIQAQRRLLDERMRLLDERMRLLDERMQMLNDREQLLRERQERIESQQSVINGLQERLEPMLPFEKWVLRARKGAALLRGVRARS